MSGLQKRRCDYGTPRLGYRPATRQCQCTDVPQRLPAQDVLGRKNNVLCSAGDASWDVHPAVALGRSRQVALCSGVSAAKPNVPGNLFDTSPLAMCSRSHATAARHGALSPRTRRVVVSAPDAVPFGPMPLPEASGQHRKRHWSPGRDPNATTIRSGR
jgi:hypothetical protein